MMNKGSSFSVGKSNNTNDNNRTIRQQCQQGARHYERLTFESTLSQSTALEISGNVCLLLVQQLPRSAF